MIQFVDKFFRKLWRLSLCFGEMRISIIPALALFLAGFSAADAQQLPNGAFLETHCFECHDEDVQKGDLDLTNLEFDLDDPRNFLTWSRVFERVENGEMPPAKKPRPSEAELAKFLVDLESDLVAFEERIQSEQGRAAIRRLSRNEYENTLRDLLALPHLDIAESLPPEGSADHFDKSAAALDFSHVHANRLMEVADAALRQAIAPSPEKPESKSARFEMRGPENLQRNCGGLYALLKQSNAIPLIGMEVDTTVTRVRGDFIKRDPGKATDEAPFFDGLALFINNEFNLGLAIKPFKPTVAGYYKIRVNGIGVVNDHGELVPSDRVETVGFYSKDRTLGYVDLPSDKHTTAELTVWLEPDDVVKPLVASAPFTRVALPVKTKNGEVMKQEHEAFRRFRANGVAFRWFEFEGPIIEDWPPESHKRLFGDLAPGETPDDPMPVARQLLRDFLVRALRRPVTPEDMKVPMQRVNQKLRRDEPFEEAMISGFRAVLTSPDFLLMSGSAGELDGNALAERMAYFLWNSPPDNILRNFARSGKLSNPAARRQQVERMLRDPRADRFIAHFLNKWLKLEDIALTEPDANLYPEYNPLLMDSMIRETRAYFAEMTRNDLGAAHIVDSDFAMLNQRLAELYEIDGVVGNEIRRVALPADSVRGGLLTQGSLLKTTANGTTTSPVVRGTFIMEHLLGTPPPPPPPSVPAVEPDISGATTIREQLDAHREVESCAGCHAKIDPPGFALESFDVMGGFRDRYRSLEKGDALKELFIDGRKKKILVALSVDSSGQLEDGRAFQNIDEFRALLLENEEQLARNLAQQLLVYATGAPIGIADRDEVEAILKKVENKDYGVRSMIHAIVESPLFLNK